MVISTSQVPDVVSDLLRWQVGPAVTNAGTGSILLLPTGAGEPRPIETGNLSAAIAKVSASG